jgi:hypothetical protein
MANPLDKNSERQKGPTPNGGSYSIAYFKNEDGEPTTKKKARSVEIVEFDENGKAIFRTYGQINKDNK